MGTEITTTWEVLKNNNHKFNNRLDDSNCNFFFVCLLQSQANWLLLSWYCDAHLGNEFVKRFRDAQAVCSNLNHTEELDLNSRLFVWSVVFKSLSNSITQVWSLLRIPYTLCVSIMKYKWLMHTVRWYVCEWGLHYLPRLNEGPRINHIRSHNSVLGFWSIFKTWYHCELIYYMSKDLGIWPKNRKGIRPGVCCKCLPTFWKRSVFNLCRLGGFVNFSCMFVSSESFLPLILHVCQDWTQASSYSWVDPQAACQMDQWLSLRRLPSVCCNSTWLTHSNRPVPFLLGTKWNLFIKAQFLDLSVNKKSFLRLNNCPQIFSDCKAILRGQPAGLP